VKVRPLVFAVGDDKKKEREGKAHKVTSRLYFTNIIYNKSRAVAGMTARCRCKFRHISNFTAASRGFHCDSKLSN